MHHFNYIRPFFFSLFFVQLGNKLWRPGLHPDGTQQERPVRHRFVWHLPHHVAAEGSELDLWENVGKVPSFIFFTEFLEFD